MLHFLVPVRLRLSNDNFGMITRRFKVNRLQENGKKLIFFGFEDEKWLKTHAQIQIFKNPKSLNFEALYKKI